MKRILFLLLSVVAIVGCESECDQMSEYEKVIYDVGTSSTISAEDALKNAEVWWAVKVLYSEEPGGKGDVSVMDHEKEEYYGTNYYYLSFGSVFKIYFDHGPNYKVNDPEKGWYDVYMSYYVDYDYKLNSDNSFELNPINNLDDPLANPIKMMRLLAYNESRIVVEVAYSNWYMTYVLKPCTLTDFKKWEELNFVDIETFIDYLN